jgi:Holliday junction resolvase RusA-like endonuclease
MLLAGPVVPYTRMTRNCLWRDDAQRYLASKTALSVQMRAQMADHRWTMFPARIPLRLCIAFGWCVHTHDLSNLLKAVEDAGNRIIWADDRWIDRIETSREAWGNLGLELWVQPLNERTRRQSVARSDRMSGRTAR